MGERSDGVADLEVADVLEAGGDKTYFASGEAGLGGGGGSEKS